MRQAHQVKRENGGKTLLDRIRVRMIQQGEREELDRLLEQRHYLKSSRIGGRHVRCVAEVDGRWIALLAFSGEAPHLKGRDYLFGLKGNQSGILQRAQSALSEGAFSPSSL